MAEHLDDPTRNDLQFHLYWNAWRDDRSTWQRERALAGAHAIVRPSDGRASTSTSVRLDAVGSTPSQVKKPPAQGEDTSDSTSRATFIAPDDGNADDRTVMEAPLPQPSAPGAARDHRSDVDRSRAAHVRPHRRHRQLLLHRAVVPKLGVLQDAGWNCHQFHAGTEFFSDYGVYDVG